MSQKFLLARFARKVPTCSKPQSGGFSEWEKGTDWRWVVPVGESETAPLTGRNFPTDQIARIPEDEFAISLIRPEKGPENQSEAKPGVVEEPQSRATKEKEQKRTPTAQFTKTPCFFLSVDVEGRRVNRGAVVTSSLTSTALQEANATAGSKHGARENNKAKHRGFFETAGGLVLALRIRVTSSSELR